MSESRLSRTKKSRILIAGPRGRGGPQPVRCSTGRAHEEVDDVAHRADLPQLAGVEVQFAADPMLDTERELGEIQAAKSNGGEYGRVLDIRAAALPEQDLAQHLQDLLTFHG